MGEDGYMDIARRLMIVAERMKNGINAIEVNASYNFWLIHMQYIIITWLRCMFVVIAGAVCVWYSSHDNTLIQLFGQPAQHICHR